MQLPKTKKNNVFNCFLPKLVGCLLLCTLGLSNPVPLEREKLKIPLWKSRHNWKSCHISLILVLRQKKKSWFWMYSGLDKETLSHVFFECMRIWVNLTTVSLLSSELLQQRWYRGFCICIPDVSGLKQFRITVSQGQVSNVTVALLSKLIWTQTH